MVSHYIPIFSWYSMIFLCFADVLSSLTLPSGHGSQEEKSGVPRQGDLAVMALSVAGPQSGLLDKAIEQLQQYLLIIQSYIIIWLYMIIIQTILSELFESNAYWWSTTLSLATMHNCWKWNW